MLYVGAVRGICVDLLKLEEVPPGEQEERLLMLAKQLAAVADELEGTLHPSRRAFFSRKPTGLRPAVEPQKDGES